MGIEPTPSAWKAEVLPLNYTRLDLNSCQNALVPLMAALRNLLMSNELVMVEGEGFEPSKSEPTDLQSAPFDRSGTPPKRSRVFCNS